MFYLFGFSHIIVIRKAPLPPIITFSLKRWENLEFWREWDVAKVTHSLRWESIEHLSKALSTLLCCIPCI